MSALILQLASPAIRSRTLALGGGDQEIIFHGCQYARIPISGNEADGVVRQRDIGFCQHRSVKNSDRVQRRIGNK